MCQYKVPGDCLVGHSYGTSIEQGSVNAQLGEMLFEMADGRPMIADRTLVDAVPGGESQMALIVEGQVSNKRCQGVGTAGTWIQAFDYMRAHNLEQPVNISQADHTARSLWLAHLLKLSPTVPEGLPTDFDVDSEQLWTRSKTLWIPGNILGYVAAAKYYPQIRARRQAVKI